MNPPNSSLEYTQFNPTAVLAQLLGNVHKDDISTDSSTHIPWYLVTHCKISAHEIFCLKARDHIFIMIPTGILVTDEDLSNMKMKRFAKNYSGYDIFAERNFTQV